MELGYTVVKFTVRELDCHHLRRGRLILRRLEREWVGHAGALGQRSATME